MTLKKPLAIASLTAAVALAAVSTKAEAGDPVLGALIGGGIGAAIGHNANHHNGAAVGGVLGAMVGSSIAASSGGYYGDPYYGGPSYGSGSYYGPGYAPAPAAPRYGYGYAPAYAPAYYVPPVRIVYSSGPRYYGHRHHYRGRHW
jgi:hypothetical protein